MASKKKLADVIGDASLITSIIENAEACADAFKIVEDGKDDIKTTRFTTTCDFIFVYNKAGTTQNWVWNAIEAAIAAAGIDIKSDGKHDVCAWVRRVRPVAKKMAQKYKKDLDAIGCANSQAVVDFMTKIGHTSFAKMDSACKEDARKLTEAEQKAADDMAKLVMDLIDNDDDSEAILSQCEQVVRARVDQAKVKKDKAALLPTINLGTSASQATG